MTKRHLEHLQDDELVLHFYREGDTAHVAAHLAGCDDCRGAFARIEAELGLADGLRVPARPESYGDDVWQRLEMQLATDAAAAVEPAAPATQPASSTSGASWLDRFRIGLAEMMTGRALAFGGSLAALLVVVFWLGYGAGERGAEPIPQQVRERILLVAVGDHLERSQRLLIEIAHAEPAADLDISSHRAAAEELAGQNRLYRQTAAKGGDETVSELLGELERLLVEIANGPDSLARNELAQLQRRIERRGILFKIRVIGNDVRQQEAAAPPQV